MSEISTENREEASRLVDEAEAILGSYFNADGTLQDGAVESFRNDGVLLGVKELYDAAIRLAPDEDSFPWNFASSLDRLGVSKLALRYIKRAVWTAADKGDDEWSGVGAYLAIVEVALNANDINAARTALAKAQRLDPTGTMGSQDKRLIRRAWPIPTA
jgi:tetratricopeptide (TPR) repeat protein